MSASSGSTDSSLLIKRNCSMTPRAVLTVLAVTTAVSFAIGALFAWKGLWLVLPFAGLEMAALAAAFYVNGLHAGDYERFSSIDGLMLVEVRDGERVVTHRFNPQWVRLVVEETRRDVRLVLRSHGRDLAIGRHLNGEGRRLLASELDRVLARSRGASTAAGMTAGGAQGI